MNNDQHEVRKSAPIRLSQSVLIQTSRVRPRLFTVDLFKHSTTLESKFPGDNDQNKA